MSFTMDNRLVCISPKELGYVPVPGVMLSLTACCPKCRHVFPVGPCCAQPHQQQHLQALSYKLSRPPSHRAPSDRDLHLLARAVQHLRLSGWYYEDLTWQASQRALQDTQPGTFLIRDSGDHNFLYSLSVQTAKGPTSVRLHYANGLFRLDADTALAHAMPQFDSVVKLVEHYVRVTEARRAGLTGYGQVWVDSKGGQHSPVEVRRALHRAPCSLKHLSRLAVNKAVRDAAPPQLPLLPPLQRLGLPTSLREYLAEYPFTC